MSYKLHPYGDRRFEVMKDKRHIAVFRTHELATAYVDSITWISVEDRLPEVDSKYKNFYPDDHERDIESIDPEENGIFWDGNHWVFENVMSHVVLVLVSLKVSRCEGADPGETGDRYKLDHYVHPYDNSPGHWYQYDNVTHWMPLPNPPA